MRLRLRGLYPLQSECALYGHHSLLELWRLLLCLSVWEKPSSEVRSCRGLDTSLISLVNWGQLSIDDYEPQMLRSFPRPTATT